MENRVLVKKYKLLEPLASGGMATVYLAKNLATDEIVVAKIPNFAGLPNRDKLEKRFLREAQILSRIHSKYVVKIHDFGQDENTQEYFLILEYLHGKTLEEICAREKLPIPTIVDIASQISEVLEDLYQQGIVHRDIKSSNIKITSEGNIKLFDFGISKGGDLPAMTRSTDFLGTIQYMSPEQTEGSEVDIRSDIYSLGIVIYEMLFQKLPFDAPSPVEVLEMQRKKEPKIPPEARDRNIPASLLAVMFRCLEKQPDKRFQSPLELLQALTLVSEEFGISSSERDELRKTRLTSVAALGSSIPPFERKRRRKLATAIALVGVLLVTSVTSFFTLRSCLNKPPDQIDFKIAQGERAKFEVPITKPPETESTNVTIKDVPTEKGITVFIEKSPKPEDDNASYWIFTIYAGLTTDPGYYSFKANIQTVKKGGVSDDSLKDLIIEVVKGNLGSKAIKIVAFEELDPNAKLETAVDVDGKIMMPLDPIADATHAFGNYDPKEKKYTYSTADKTVELVVGKDTMKNNGQEQKISDAPEEVNGTMVVTPDVAETATDTDITVSDNKELTFVYKEPGQKVKNIEFIAYQLDDQNKKIDGVNIFINGILKGKTPFKIELPYGRYFCGFSKDGYKEVGNYLLQVTVNRREKEEFYLEKITIPEEKKPEETNNNNTNIKPEKTTGTLTLSVNVPWGNFTVNGKTYENTQSKTLELPEGEYKIDYYLPVINLSKSKTVKVSRNKTSNCTFEIESGVLIVKSTIDLVIYINNAPPSSNAISSPTKPLKINIAAGTYSIKSLKSGNFFFDNGQHEQIKTAVVKPGEVTTVEFIVTKKP